MKTREEVIETMRKAAGDELFVDGHAVDDEIVARAIRAALAALEAGGHEIVTRGAIEAASREEREACASKAREIGAAAKASDQRDAGEVGHLIANAIRARP
jgi:hypothetical protein